MGKYANVKQAALRLLSVFVSNDVCESVLSTLKHVRSKHHTVFTDIHVKELLRVATTEYKPDLKQIVENKEHKRSHRVKIRYMSGRKYGSNSYKLSSVIIIIINCYCCSSGSCLCTHCDLIFFCCLCLIGWSPYGLQKYGLQTLFM